MAQQTNPIGDDFRIEATPKQVQFYKDKFAEILNGEYLNPQVGLAIKTTKDK